MIDALWTAVAIAATLAAAKLAYRAGYRRGRPPFPDTLRVDLAVHKRECLGEPPARVERELNLFLGAARSAAPRAGTAAGRADRVITHADPSRP